MASAASVEQSTQTQCSVSVSSSSTGDASTEKSVGIAFDDSSNASLVFSAALSTASDASSAKIRRVSTACDHGRNVVAPAVACSTGGSRLAIKPTRPMTVSSPLVGKTNRTLNTLPRIIVCLRTPEIGGIEAA